MASVSREADPAVSVLAFFGTELRRARVAADMTQEDLAARINYSAALVGMIENAKRTPSRDLSERCDDVLETDGQLTRLWPLVARDELPAWFRPWIELEAEATALRSFEPLVIPGLLQTEAYARALLGAEPAATEESLDQRVAARMQRQQLLARDNAPHLWCVIDEGVLHRSVGGPKVMFEQLQQLAEMSCRPKIAVQVISFDVGSHPGLLGGFVIASFPAAGDTLYLETAASGQITEQPSVVAELTLTFDTLRSEALPRTASRELVRKVAEDRWN